MTANNLDMQALTNQIGGLQINSAYNCNDFYGPNAKVGYARLDKGLLLFVYLHETSGALKSNARLYDKLRDRQICYHTIVYNRYHDPYYCSYDHSEAYRQQNLCREWYMGNCSRKSCQRQHFFISTNAKRYINNDTDLKVWDLIRFIRHFSCHFIQSVIVDNDIQSLYQGIVVIMMHIVDCAFRDIDKLRLFLHGSTINQLNQDILQKLAHETSYHVPEIFLTPDNIVFTSRWYIQSSRKVSIKFGNLSREFIQYLHDQLHKYYSERLQDRGNRLHE